MARKKGAKGGASRDVTVTAKRFKGPNIDVEGADEKLSPHDRAMKFHYKGAKNARSFSDPLAERVRMGND